MADITLADFEQHLKSLESSLNLICEHALRAEQFSKHAWMLAMETFHTAEHLRQTASELKNKDL